MNVARRALMVFHDDSSLAVARGFADLIAAQGWRPEFLLYRNPLTGPPDLSPRQLAQGLGPHPLAHRRTGLDAADPTFLAGFALVASAKYPVLFRRLWRWRAWAFDGPRPCFLGLFPGLELQRATGWRIRRYADVLCCVSRSDAAAYRAFAPPGRPAHQRVLRLHPALMRRAPMAARTWADRPRVATFFTQSVAPETLAGRRAVLATLVEAARANPETCVTLKLRHRRDENRRHTHVERWSYEALLAEVAAPPPNLRFSDAPMADALAETDLAITCSSTAGAEAAAAGTPTLFLLDYPGADREPTAASMRALLAGSGLTADRAAVVALERRRPAPAWAEDVFSTPADLHAALAAVDAFHAAPAAASSRAARFGARLARAAMALDLAFARRLRSAVVRLRAAAPRQGGQREKPKDRREHNPKLF